MSDKFKDVPMDEGTISGSRKQLKIGNFDVLHEHWGWEGIAAESFIFLSKDIEGVSDKELKELVVESGKWDYDSQILVKKTESGYTFVNFNFEVVS